MGNPKAIFETVFELAVRPSRFAKLDENANGKHGYDPLGINYAILKLISTMHVDKARNPNFFEPFGKKNPNCYFEFERKQ